MLRLDPAGRIVFLTLSDPFEVMASTPSVLPLETTVGHLIRRAQQVHTGLWVSEFGGELTGPQYAVLSVLTRRSELDQRSAGQLASLDKSSAADVMARLQRGGWLGRDRSAPDSRRNVVALTAVARVALRYITPRVLVVQNALLAPLSTAERRWFTSNMAQVAYAGSPPVSDAGAMRDDAALPLETAAGHLVRRAEQVHRLRWAQQVGAGITPAQYGLLSALAWHPGIDQSAAGDRASLDKSTTADVIRRLARRGYVAVARDERDRRRKLLALTSVARRDLTVMTPGVELVQADLLQPLPAAAAERLVACLHAIAYR